MAEPVPDPARVPPPIVVEVRLDLLSRQLAGIQTTLDAMVALEQRQLRELDRIRVAVEAPGPAVAARFTMAFSKPILERRN